jgi:hypothetical protein
MAIFFQIFYFWWKLGPITVDAEDPSTLFNGRNTVTFFGLESCIAFNSRKAVPTTTSISARTWCPRPLWAPSFTHGYRPCALTYNNHCWLGKNSIFFFSLFFWFWYIFLKHFMFGGPPTIASAPMVWWRASQTWIVFRVF